jgi:hypothetical protein
VTLTAALSAAVPAAARPGVSQAANDRLSTDFRALEEQRSRAIAGHDARFLASLYAEGFIGVGNRGAEVDRATILALLARFDGSVDVRPDWIRAIPLGRNAAAVRGRLTGRNKEGTIVAQSLFLHIYERRGGRWRIVTGQSTAVPGDSFQD